ncbi:MAG: DUF3047 domain-containing protein [Bacteroidota bacterium]
MLHTSLSILLLWIAGLPIGAVPAVPADSSAEVMIEDFQEYQTGHWPTRWRFIYGKDNAATLDELVADDRSFLVREERGRKFLRMETHGRSLRISLRAGIDFDWDIEEHPRISWEWRAHELPVDAREDRLNDTGAALYVTFGADWLGRPRSIKYTYSTLLPKGTVVRFGSLRVLVVDTGLEGTGEWKTVDRDVMADYRQIFGGEPPRGPVSITLWSDSDDTRSSAIADFDNIRLLPPRR